MSDLLKRLKAGSENNKFLNWPGTENKVVMQILTVAQLQEAIIATENIFKKADIAISIQGGSLPMIDEFEAERITQVLYRALRDPEKLTEPIAPTITEFRALLSNAERDELGKEYIAYEKECSPSPDTLSKEEFESLYQGLKKNATQTIGSVSSISTAKKLMLCLVKQLETSQRASGSTSTHKPK